MATEEPLGGAKEAVITEASRAKEEANMAVNTVANNTISMATSTSLDHKASPGVKTKIGAEDIWMDHPQIAAYITGNLAGQLCSL